MSECHDDSNTHGMVCEHCEQRVGTKHLPDCITQGFPDEVAPTKYDPSTDDAHCVPCGQPHSAQSWRYRV